MVLSGRESLIRLIGKRRRFLPNRRSILSDPIPNPNPNPISSPNPNPVLLLISSNFSLLLMFSVTHPLRFHFQVVEQPPQQPDQNGDVQCPVCGRNLPGDDYNRINSHLGMYARYSHCLYYRLHQCFLKLFHLNFHSQMHVSLFHNQNQQQNESFPSVPSFS